MHRSRALSQSARDFRKNIAGSNRYFFNTFRMSPKGGSFAGVARRPLQNAPFCPISAKASLKCQRQSQILSLEILNVFLHLKFSPSLNLNKIEHFSKVSQGMENFFTLAGL